MRIITVTVLLMTLMLTAGVVNADLRDDCVSKCALNKRACDDGCPRSPVVPLTYDVRGKCLQDCENTLISCSDSCPQHASSTSPSTNSSSNESYSAKPADKEMVNESSK